MEVNFGDTVPLSTLDWPNKATITIFLRKCCFKCPFCQNHELIDGEEFIPIQKLFEKINESKKFVDGVIVSGGEPTLQLKALKKLSEFSTKNDLGFGLHTNGYYPKRIEQLLKKNHLDFISLDIKAPLDNEKKYSEVTGVEMDPRKIKETHKHLKKSDVEYEITTTLFRNKIDLKEAKEISNYLEKEKYVLQQGRSENAYREEYRKLSTFSMKELIGLAKKIDYPNLFVRTKEEGEFEV